MSLCRPLARLVVVVALAAVTLVVGASCQEPTSISIEARTNVTWRPGLVVGFTAGRPGETEGLEPVTETRDPWDTSGLIGTLTVIPDSGDDGVVALKLVMGVRRETSACKPPSYEGCIVARRRVRYVPNQRLRLPMSLYAQCVDIPCDADSTCDALGLCVTDEAVCVGGVCDLNAPSATPPADATTNDGSPSGDDAAVDAPVEDARGSTDGSSTNVIDCPGSRACTAPVEHCCFDLVAHQGSCADVATSACPDFTITCDGPEDCANGFLCCSVGNGQECRPEIACPVVVCHSNGVCATGTCQGSSGYYRRCS